jgi:hypothetical protein
VPEDTPVATPDTTPIVATGIEPENQKPPVGVLARAVVAPTHTPSEPVMGVGTTLTLTVMVEKQVAIP